MPFLTLNGVTVPVDSSSEAPNQIYGDARGYLGFGMKGRVARKRTWSIKTIPMDHETAQALLGIVTCRGDVWGFDDLTLFSQKGILAGIGVAAVSQPVYVPNSAAADGSFNPCAPPFSAYAMYAQTGRQNVMPTANDSSYETSNPLTAVAGTTVAQDSTRYYAGTKSVKVTDATGTVGGRGVQSAVLTGFTASATACFSILVYNGLGAAAPFALSILSDTAVSLGAASVTIPNGGWYRVAIRFTLPSTGKFQWQLYTTSTGFPGSWWVDGAQLEYAVSPSPYIGVGVPAIGPSVNATGNFGLPFSNATNGGGPDSADSEVSVACWTQFTGLNDSTVRNIFNLRALGANPQIALRYVPTNLNVIVTNDSGTALNTFGTTLTNLALTDAWHYVVLNLRTSPHAGGYWMELIIDGVRVASLPASSSLFSTMPTLSKLNVLQMDFGGVAGWNGQFNEIQVNPYCLPLGIAQQLYANQPTVRPVAPRIIGNGTMFGNQATVLQGSKATLAAQFLHGSANPTGLGPQAVLSFTLDEI